MALNRWMKVHHRNPSGFNNKVRWLLSESKRDLGKLQDIGKSLPTYPNTAEGQSWSVALLIAQNMITENYSQDVREYMKTIYVPEWRRDEKDWYHKIMFK